jgi:CheY-like chemotaxis protein
MLRPWGGQSIPAADGPDALDALVHAVRPDEPPVLVMLDVHQTGSNGLDLAEQIRERWSSAEVGIVVMTSSMDPHFASQTRRLDLAGQIAKPFLSNDLLPLLHQVFKAHAQFSPGRSDESAHASQAVPRIDPDHPPLRVLLVESTRVNNRLARHMLERSGHSVDVAENGRDAVAAFETQRFDAILLDVHEPALYGFEAAKAIRELEADAGGRTRIVALLAQTRDHDVKACFDAGMDAYLEKPIRPDRLWEALYDTRLANQAETSEHV